jgi:hypothetical protein
VLLLYHFSAIVKGMKRPSLLSVYAAILMIIFGGIVVHAPLSVWLGTVWPDYDLLIKSWKELLMILAAGLALILVSRRRLWDELGRDWLFRLIVLYAALHLIMVAVFPDTLTSLLAGLAIDLRYVLFFALVYILIRLAPHYRRPIIWVAGMGAAIVVGFASLQLFLPADILSHIGYSRDTIVPYLTVDMNPDYVRVNSTLRGPNPLGAYAGMVLALLAALLVRQKVNLKDKKVLIATCLVMVCAVVALWVSYSRSALVAALVSLLMIVAASAAARLSRRSWLVIGAVVLMAAGGLLIARDTSFVSNVLLHEDPSGGNEINSNEGHIESLSYGLDRLIHQPLGAGVGSTGSASLFGDQPVIIENQYLFIAHEIGWLGLLVFAALFVIVMIRLWRVRSDWLGLGVFASGIGLALIGILLPVWVDDTVSIIWWGLAAVVLGGRKHVR